ncbi:MAG: EAL domain-containing protein, partial [Acidimicrobiia bacterium]|nr:EAL domain-containing protein [Acidimicrobiia bacterium]
VSQREGAQAEAARSEARLGALLLEASDVVMVIGKDGQQLSYVSPSIERVMGWSTEFATGLTWRQVIHPDHLQRWIDVVTSVAEDPQGRRQIELKGLHKDGTWRWLDASILNRFEDPLIEGIILHFHDVTPRHLAEQELARRSLHDSLTGLPNRVLFVDRLESALNRRQRSGGLVALLYCDLDRFKNVNDTIGHSGADLLLCEVARRMEIAIRAGDSLARLHGDEFVVCAEEIDSWEEAQILANRLRRDLSKPFILGGREIYLTTSIGIAISSKDNPHSASDLLENADAAMFVAKKGGRDRIAFYNEEVRSRELSDLAIRDEIRGAIENDELVLHYQPIYDLTSGALIGTEALVRWQHPVRGLLYPADFIPVAEESGLIVAIGSWVIESAMRQAKDWGFGTARQAKMWINVSALQLERIQIVDEITAQLSRFAIPSHAIGIELTETALIDAQPEIDTRLRILRDLGYSIAIDDFGTGYSSLLYLRRYSADTLKIDRAFVSGLGVSRDDTAIVSSLRSLAAMLELRVVAEGVETQDQLQALRAMGCESASGYLLARPADSSVISQLLDEPLELIRSHS